MSLKAKKVCFLLIAVFLMCAIGLLRMIHEFSVTTLSAEQVSQRVSSIPSECSDLRRCRLERGDILMRRHITKKTLLFERITQSYFTHAAVYLGAGMIVQAKGSESNASDEIMVESLESSDWMTDSLEGWVVIRPHDYVQEDLDRAVDRMRQMADDDRYTFGIRLSDDDQLHATSCADLIFRQYRLAGLVSDNDMPFNVSPDYLFQYIVTHPDEFGIIAHRIPFFK